MDDNGDLREIGFLKLGIEGFPTFMGFGEFSNNMEKYRYIATEFISGESVLDRMKRNGPLNEFDATFVVLRIAVKGVGTTFTIHLPKLALGSKLRAKGSKHPKSLQGVFIP